MTGASPVVASRPIIESEDRLQGWSLEEWTSCETVSIDVSIEFRE